MKFTYRTGDQPLEGYTIKRGVGRGGFGEVYFALSEGGKEVALKLLHGQSDVELRGVANCLNLKHPNLVHVYDLKEDAKGDKWLVMEYVLGESLASLLNRHPNGLSVNLAKEWFASLAKAVGHLHDRGVVHRDLKPANIFIESGTLKVGDYGLCKSISTSQRHTRTVGTVHYMAPEVSTGNYSQGIDIYACGILLYEMLTGRLPFDGESDGEILMKQMTATPDLSPVPEPFRPIIEKALEKDPRHRFGSISEMAKAVEAANATATPVTPKPAAAQPPPLQPPPIPKREPPTVVLPVAKRVVPPTRRDRWTGTLSAMLFVPWIAAIGLVPYAFVTHTSSWTTLGNLFAVTTAAGWAILLGSGGAGAKAEDSWGRRWKLGFFGLLVGMLAYWLEGGAMPRWHTSSSSPGAQPYLFGWVEMPPDSFAVALRYGLYFGGILAAGRWWRIAARDRKERFSLYPVVAMGFCAAVLLFLWPWEVASASSGFVPLVLGVIAVQSASPWQPVVEVRPAKRLRLRTA
jgi:serine/threonine protein kinase